MMPIRPSTPSPVSEEKVTSVRLSYSGSSDLRASSLASRSDLLSLSAFVRTITKGS